jgi:hypothetical protein
MDEDGDISPGNGKDQMTGRFVAGNRYGTRNPGNAMARRMAELRRTLVESVTPEETVAVFRKLYRLALDGDVAAIKLFLEYSAGKPVQGIELSVEQLQVVPPIFQLIPNPRDVGLPPLESDGGNGEQP